MKNDQNRPRDWWSISMLGFMVVAVIGCSVFAWRVIDNYSAAFEGQLLPLTKTERATSSQGTVEPAKENGTRSAEVRAELGQLGDFFGGTLNPLFGFVSIIALLLTIIYQARELKLSTEELRNSAVALNAQNLAIDHQRFEQTFFAWLGTYRDLLESVEHVKVKRTKSNDEVIIEYRGRRALRFWWEEYISIEPLFFTLREQRREEIEKERIEGESIKLLLARLANNGWHGIIAEAGLGNWERLYSHAEYHLDSLFRVLYRLLLWIDSQPAERLNLDQKWLYISIVRAQLSWIEMVYFFYNGHTTRGKKFKKLAEKYALFDNLTFESDPVIKLVRTYPPDGNKGYAQTAYDSTEARTAMGLSASTEEAIAKAAVPQAGS